MSWQSRVRRLSFSVPVLAASLVACQAQTQPTNPAQAPNQNQQKVPLPPGTQASPVTTTLVPLPQGAPTTSAQGPLPNSAKPLPKADQPLLYSPSAAVIRDYLANHPMTMDDALAIALYTNRSLATAIANLQAAQGRTGAARAGLNPTIGVNSQLTYYGRDIVVSFPGVGHIVILPHFNPINTAAFTLPLDISGTIHSAVSQAQFNEVAARIDVNRTRNQIIADVKAAFYNVLRAQAQLGVATDNVNVSLARLSDANKNYAAGTSPYFDVLSSQRDLADAQQALIVAQGQVSTALTNLKNTIGLDPSTPVQISDAGAVQYPNGVPVPPPPSTTTAQGAVPPGNTETPMTAPNANYTPLASPDPHVASDTFTFGPEFQSALTEALSTRPEILEAQAQVTAAQRGIQYARRSELPSVSLSLQYTNTPNATGFSLPNQEAATLGISVPLFDGGLARANVEQARAQVAVAEVNRRQAQDQVSVDVRTAYIALVQARNRVAVTNYEVAQAQESFRLAQIRYNAGMSTAVSSSPQLEIINAQTSLTQARTDQVNALYDYNNARAQFDRAVGRYSYAGSGPGYPSVPSQKTVGAK